MNTKTSPLIIKDSECELILNYNLDKTGALTKRDGYDVFSTRPVSSVNILGLFQFTHTGTPGNTNPLMVANISGNANSVIYEDVAGTWTSRDTSSTASLKTRFATFLDYAFRVNGTDTVLTSTNLTAWGTTNAPSTITPSFIAIFQDRVYVARTGASEGSRVYFSALPASDVITWDTTNDNFDVNPDDGDEITALENNGNRLLIFKNRALYRWDFGQTEPDRLIGIGTQSQECVKTNLDLGITFFANELGAYAYTGGRPKLISRKIQDWFDNVPAADVNDFAAETDADHYYLYLSDSMTVDRRTYTNVMAVYTISLDAWTIWTLDVPVRVMAKLIQSSSEDIYFGSNNGRTYQLLRGTADDSAGANVNTASPIAGEIITKEHLLSFPEDTTVDFVDVISNPGVNSHISVILDGADPVSLGNLKNRIDSFGVNKKNVSTAQLLITDHSQFTSVIEGYSFEHTPRARKNA